MTESLEHYINDGDRYHVWRGTLFTSEKASMLSDDWEVVGAHAFSQAKEIWNKLPQEDIPLVMASRNGSKALSITGVPSMSVRTCEVLMFAYQNFLAGRRYEYNS